jgi:hypothetical protein
MPVLYNDTFKLFPTHAMLLNVTHQKNDSGLELASTFPFMIIRKIKLKESKWVEHIVCMVKRRNLYNTLVDKPEKKKLVTLSGHRWESNIKMDLRGIQLRRYGLDSSGSKYGPAVVFCEYSNEHSLSLKGGEFLD